MTKQVCIISSPLSVAVPADRALFVHVWKIRNFVERATLSIAITYTLHDTQRFKVKKKKSRHTHSRRQKK
jgi:hypothetical protein